MSDRAATDKDPSSRGAGRKEAPLGASKSERSELVRPSRSPPRALLRESMSYGLVWLKEDGGGLYVEISQPLRRGDGGFVRWVNVRVRAIDVPVLERVIARFREEESNDGVSFRAPDSGGV